MNMQRNILIAALAVITYLMILQWNKDYGDPVIEAAVNGSNAQTQVADVPAVPGAELNPAQNSDDVPQAVEVVDGVDIPVVQPVTAAATAGGLISVETDTLRLTIDPRGGDIISLVCRNTRYTSNVQMFLSSCWNRVPSAPILPRVDWPVATVRMPVPMVARYIRPGRPATSWPRVKTA